MRYVGKIYFEIEGSAADPHGPLPIDVEHLYKKVHRAATNEENFGGGGLRILGSECVPAKGEINDNKEETRA